MFAVTPKILLNIVQESKDFGLSEFETENEYSQASTAHMFERFIGLSAYSEGGHLICTSIVDYLDLKALSVKLI